MALGAAACGAPAAREESAASAGAAFEAAVASGDHVRACGLLAPGTREQLLQDERRPCPGALAAQGLPRTHGVRTTEAYGRQALVRMAGDTLFLSLFDSGWKVVAAGCTARPGRPYDCTLKGT
ncbi:hypothetical protein VO63_26385 [Streptomyces showdoensis]|uniref:Uncharacterized protein n=2 Tax=Streptomyces showdoensis TaxID=68268 RepID=A0A2P2GHE4_STREW|nr:hypothetical protein VO63_26385 [Streptomyces showdoensis]